GVVVVVVQHVQLGDAVVAGAAPAITSSARRKEQGWCGRGCGDQASGPGELRHVEFLPFLSTASWTRPPRGRSRADRRTVDTYRCCEVVGDGQGDTSGQPA